MFFLVIVMSQKDIGFSMSKLTNLLLVEMSFLMKKTWNWEDKKIENTAIISSNQEEDEKDEVVSQGKEIPDSDNEEPPPRGTKMLSVSKM